MGKKREKQARELMDMMEYMGVELDDKPSKKDKMKALESLMDKPEFFFMSEKKQERKIKEKAREICISRLLADEGLTKRDINNTLDYGFQMLSAFPDADRKDRTIMAIEAMESLFCGMPKEEVITYYEDASPPMASVNEMNNMFTLVKLTH